MSKQRLALDGGAPVRTAPFPSREALFGETDVRYLKEVLDSGESQPRRRAEDEGAGGAVRGDAGNAATRWPFLRAPRRLHTAVGMIDPNPGDEIITTPLTDMGTVIGILFPERPPRLCRYRARRLSPRSRLGAAEHHRPHQGHHRRAFRRNGRGYGRLSADQRGVRDSPSSRTARGLSDHAPGPAGGDDGEGSAVSACSNPSTSPPATEAWS